MRKNSLGFSVDKAQEIVTDLNVLLANFQVYYQNLRAFHWNIKGKHFFDLHVKFEELYTDAQLKIDTIAERILTLEGVPLHTFTDYITHTQIQQAKNITQDTTTVTTLIENISILLSLERSILAKSADNTDEATAAMLSDFITEQEKTIWMFKAWLA